MVERNLIKFVPDEFKQHAHHWLILHGRYTCKAIKPACPACGIADLCEFKAKTKPEQGAPGKPLPPRVFNLKARKPAPAKPLRVAAPAKVKPTPKRTAPQRAPVTPAKRAKAATPARKQPA